MGTKTRARFVCLLLVWAIVFGWFTGRAAQAEDTTTTTAATTPATTTTVASATTTAVPATTSTTVAASQVSEAPPTTEAPIEIAVGGEGVDGMVPAVKLRADGLVPTLTERYPPGAYVWDGSYGMTDVVNAATERFLADPGLTILVGWGTLVTRTMTWVWTVPAIGADIIDGINGVVRDHGTWKLWATGMLLGVGCYVVILALRQRALEAVSHIGWTLALGVLSFAFLWVPGRVLTAANEGTSNLSRWTLATLSAADPRTQVPDGTTQAATYGPDEATNAVRRAQDTWWRLFVVLPWATGELGTTTGVPAGTVDHILELKSGDVGNLTDFEKQIMDPASPSVALCPDQGRLGGSLQPTKGAAGVACARGKEWTAYRDDVLRKLPGVDPWISGRKPMERAGIAWLGLLIALPSGALLAGMSVAMLYWSYAGIIRLMALPLYALRGMAPPHGPRTFVRYAQATAAMFVKRVVVGGLMALVLIAEVVVSSTLATRGWWAMALGQMIATVVLVSLWVQHRKDERLPIVPRPPVRRHYDRLKTGYATGRNLATKAALLPSAMSTRTLFDGTTPRNPGVDRRVRTKSRDATSTPVEETVDRGWWDPPDSYAEKLGHELGWDGARGALLAGPGAARAHGPVQPREPLVVGPGRRPVAELGAGPRVHQIETKGRVFVAGAIEASETPERGRVAE